MTEIRRRSHGLSYTQKWFARYSRARDAIGLVAFFQFLGVRPRGPFVRRRFTTVHIDLGRPVEDVLAEMHRNVRAEIRRADTEGISWSVDVDPREFASFHQAFAREKGIGGVSAAQLQSIGSALVLTRACLDSRVLAQHAYIVDQEERRARFLYSSSGRFEGANAALAGRANRWCHWKDMLYLRERGIRVYDLGGIAVGSGAAAERAGIDEFKMRFGGTVVEEDHWLSPMYALADALRLR